MDENEIVELDETTEDTLYDTSEMEVIENTEEMVVKPHKKENKDAKKQDEQTPLENFPKKPKKKKEFFWKKLSKKGKVITIICLIIIICAITATVLIFTVFQKKEVVEDVIVKNDNFIYKNGSLSLLNDKGKEIGVYECKNQDAEKCYVAKLSTEDEFDTDQYLNEKSEKLEQTSQIYNDRFVFIYDNSKIVLYDIEKKKTSGNYKLIKTGSIDKDYVVAKDKDDKYGIINIMVNKAKTLVDFDYKYLGIINSDEVFVAKDDSYYFLIDSTGTKKSVNYEYPIKSFNDSYVSLYASGTGYKIYDYNGTDLTNMHDTNIDYVKFEDKYIEVVSNKKLYFYDSDKNCLNPSGVKLKSTYYNKTYMFDKNNDLQETYQAYETKFTDGNILVILSDKSEVNINTYEGDINNKYEYVSYVDGSLYFYDDASKTNQIGKYTCTNKNTVENANSEFTNCFVAKDSNIVNSNNSGYLPIINGTYVFIYDTKTGSTTDNIVLYNLTTNKAEVKYQAVDTGLGNDAIGYVSSTNSLIYAKNSKGYYLAITFGDNGPEKIIDSSDSNGNTTSITYWKDYLLVVRGSKNYLYDKNGTKLASSNMTIDSYDDGYLTVKDTSGKYTLYNFKNSPDSGTILAEGLSYLKLSSNYFIGIKNSKLNVYSYDSGKAYLTTGLDITSTDYDNAYSILETTSGYTITIGSKTYNYDSSWSLIEE